MHLGRLWHETPWPFRTFSNGGVGGKGANDISKVDHARHVIVVLRFIYCAWWYCSFDTASRSNSPWRSGSTRSLGWRATGSRHQSASPSLPRAPMKRTRRRSPCLNCQGWFHGDFTSCRRPPPSHWCRWSVSTRENAKGERRRGEERGDRAVEKCSGHD